MGQLSELQSRLLWLKLEARAALSEAEQAGDSRSSRGALESRALADATEHLWRVLDALYGKANFNPDQPRVPRGNPDGGQWTDDGGSSGEGRLQTGRSATRKPPRYPRPRRRRSREPLHDYSITPEGHIRVTIRPRPQGSLPDDPRGMGDNADKSPEELLDEPERIPRERPPTAKQRHSIVKTVARIGLTLIRTASPLGRLMNLFEVGNWLYEEFAPYIEAYWDEPTTLQELQRNTWFPAKGYDIHHINELIASRKAGFSDELINGPENLVRISRLMHWRITTYYQTIDPDLGWQTPRRYVAQMKTWEERTKFGLEVLRKFEVLK